MIFDSNSADSSESDESISIAFTSDSHAEEKLALPEDDFDVLYLQPEGENSLHEEDYELSGSMEAVQIPSQDSIKTKKRKKKKRKGYTINLANCKYESVRRVSQKSGLKTFFDAEECNIFWTDLSVTIERVCSLKRWQKVNHFPGMSEICRKDSLARNLNRMAKLFPKDFTFFPKSWCLPADWSDLQNYAKVKKHKTYILKPDSGCQGRGIYLTKSPNSIKPSENMVCQTYISRPFLIDGFKFDMRLYVLVTSCDPLRIFVFKDGLARFATQRYREPTASNVSNVFIHLTNYALQKHSDDFVKDDEESGTKRRITTVNRWLIANGYDVTKIWADVDDAIIKTVLSGYAVLKHNYRTCFPNHLKTSACFEILGFDIILDKKLKPHILEVNHSPSFHCDARLDKEIKEALLWDTLKMVNLPALDRKACIEEDKKKIRERLFTKTSSKSYKESRESWEQTYKVSAKDQLTYELQHLGNFRKIYPTDSVTDPYAQFFNASVSLYTETAAFKARTEFAKQIRDEIRQKQELYLNLNKKTNSVRPESPGRRRKSATKQTNKISNNLNPNSRSTLTSRSDNFVGQTKKNTGCDGDSISRHALPIVEREENERIAELVQRESLLRRMGVIDLIYKLLSGTSGVSPFSNSKKFCQEDLKEINFDLLSSNHPHSFNNVGIAIRAVAENDESKQTRVVKATEIFSSKCNDLSKRISKRKDDIMIKRLESRSSQKKDLTNGYYWLNGSLKKPPISRQWFSVAGSPMTISNFITKPAIISREREFDLNENSSNSSNRRATTGFSRVNKPKEIFNFKKEPSISSTLSRLNNFLMTSSETALNHVIVPFTNNSENSLPVLASKHQTDSLNTMAKLNEFYARNCHTGNS